MDPNTLLNEPRDFQPKNLIPEVLQVIFFEVIYSVIHALLLDVLYIPFILLSKRVRSVFA
ncbi:hypothetical protein PSTEL_10625 [Paenibacillus stellifer]|uniref:Uncharacterized protein n=1 Tax=Paenibacillus stellifer TaxID=169760 RepID=A0A089LTN5_9BACL|nr:hypothetical protein PSTEL_10625 [Paenibacillus stellifer]